VTAATAVLHAINVRNIARSYSEKCEADFDKGAADSVGPMAQVQWTGRLHIDTDKASDNAAIAVAAVVVAAAAADTTECAHAAAATAAIALVEARLAGSGVADASIAYDVAAAAAATADGDETAARADVSAAELKARSYARLCSITTVAYNAAEEHAKVSVPTALATEVDDDDVITVLASCAAAGSRRRLLEAAHPPYCAHVDPIAGCVNYCPIVAVAGKATYAAALAEHSAVTAADIAAAAAAAALSTGTAEKAAADVELAKVPADAYIALEDLITTSAFRQGLTLVNFSAHLSRSCHRRPPAYPSKSAHAEPTSGRV